MKFIKPIFALALAILTIQACKKKVDDDDKKDDTGGKSKLELLSQKRWKISNLISSGTDIWNTPFVESCSKDNQYLFRTDDSLVLFDMASKCNSSDPDSTVSSYKLINNNTQIVLNVKLTSSVTLNDTAKITELTESSMKIDAEYSGLPANITFIHP